MVVGWDRPILYNKPISFFRPHFFVDLILYRMPSELTQWKSLMIPFHALINMQRQHILI